MAFQPDVLVLVDYPGFNLRMAAWANPKEYGGLLYPAQDLGLEREAY